MHRPIHPIRSVLRVIVRGRKRSQTVVLPSRLPDPGAARLPLQQDSTDYLLLLEMRQSRWR
ncbi:hypothetical protein ACIQCF_32100 [Streptomyces sp. NPDC088353]|uniref:hypothetical protein n=1 Tax=Streptomyces sp. NPDC088353 TaxID=3365855 RepID=UPI00380E9888